MKTYRAAIVGCGSRAPAHIEAYAHIDNAEVVACCAPGSARRDPLAAKYHLRAYADARKMIESERPDIVHLVTWPDTRVELMSLVAELGVPLCTTEKPLATAVSDWRKLVELENSARTRFAVCHQVRWHPRLVAVPGGAFQRAVGRGKIPRLFGRHEHCRSGHPQFELRHVAERGCAGDACVWQRQRLG